jgi:hypothetical protein
MEFQSRRVVCNEPGLSQEQALDGLYEAYGEVRVASIKRQGTSWVATILEKVAEFPPPKEKPEGGEEAPDMPEDEGAEDDADGEDGGGEEKPDGPPFGDGEGGDEGKDEKKGGEHEVLGLLHQIFQGLLDAGIVQPPMHDKMVPGNEPTPDGPPGPPPGPPGAGGPQRMQPGKMPSKLKPGEVLPTQTPVGAPAFSSVQKEAMAPCPTCGGQTMPDGSCPACETQGGVPAPPAIPGSQPGPSPMHPMIGKQATFTVESDVTSMKPSEAHSHLASEFGQHGYKVKELQYDSESQKYRALLSIR